MKTLFLFLSILFFSVSAQALPVGVNQPLDTPINFVESLDVDYDFNGIVGLNNCSGSVVHFTGQPMDSQAYVLTNGHCIGGFGGFLKPGEVRYKQRARRSMNAYVDINSSVRVRADQLVYGTMTDTDSALYRLTETYDQLRNKGVESFEMASERAPLNQEIHIVSGYWRLGYECHIEHFVHELHEGNWVMKDSIRYSATGCEVKGGTSGSPVLAKGKRLVVGVNNTGNESGRQCTQNNPCEVSTTGEKTVLKGRGYAQQTYWFYSCLNEQFEIDLSVQGCSLPKP